MDNTEQVQGGLRGTLSEEDVGEQIGRSSGSYSSKRGGQYQLYL